MKSLIITLLLQNLAFANETTTLSGADQTEINELKKDWQNGLHIIAGFGLNAANYSSGSTTSTAGVGLNLRSDVTYFLDYGFGLELSSSIMFNNLGRTLLWSTTFAGGVRFDIPKFFRMTEPNMDPYGRIMIGRSSDVAIFDGRPSKQFRDYDDYNANRVQTEGHMLGAGLGVFQESKSGRVWYAEMTVEYHLLDKAEVVEEDNGVQVVVDERNLEKHHTFYALCVTIGFMIF